MRSLELFAGCGGLAMGLSMAGFRSKCMVEWDKHSAKNVIHNQRQKVDHVREWPFHEGDVRAMDWRIFNPVELVAGGPPCQPFSIGGKHRGHEDHRDMWPEAVRAVRETMPSAFLFENVRGLKRAAFSDYLDWIVQSLSRPHVVQRLGENRAEHLARLRSENTEKAYDVSVHSVNAADFGAAQKRHRVIIIGIRRGCGALALDFRPSHSRERLLWDQWISMDYWRRHNLEVPNSGPNRTDIATVARLKTAGQKPKFDPWRTVRDAISDLGEPGNSQFSNHTLQPGARAYPGHTGSPLDQPAKALKAGVHGVPGGENMMSFDDGAVRYFTVREAARLQGLPDNYEFIGSWSENMRQLGNAVPTQLACAAGTAIIKSVFSQGNKIDFEAA
jgi:DNA (cytosine-5)-methyltransferase 1